MSRKPRVRCQCGATALGPPPRNVEAGDLYRTIAETEAIPTGWGYCARYGHVCPACIPARLEELDWLVTLA